MGNEAKMLEERISSYLSVNGIELTTDQFQDAFSSVQFWSRLTIDEVISDAITGVTYDEVV